MEETFIINQPECCCHAKSRDSHANSCDSHTSHTKSRDSHDSDDQAHAEEGHGCCCHAHHHQQHGDGWRRYWREGLSLALLLAGAALGHIWAAAPGWVTLACYAAAVLPVAWGVAADGWPLWRRGDLMNEFTLMLLAAAGAFALGEYPEGVAVLLFYSFGEKLQVGASDDVRRRIRALVGRMPRRVAVAGDDGAVSECAPEEVAEGSVIVVRPGERVAIDGVLLGDAAVAMDTSALTGESVPRTYAPGCEVSAGVLPLDREARLRTVRPYGESAMSRMMRLIDEASKAKTPTETMLRRITRWFTPAVVTLAVLVFTVPWTVSLVAGTPFDAAEWLRRSLVFFVCSCPCALVVSIPLGYYASLGSAARRGLLFKGAAHIDTLRGVDTVVLDKTGTLTTGRFHVVAVEGADPDGVLSLAAAVDRQSSHPLAEAIVAEAGRRGLASVEAQDVTTVAHGMRGRVGERSVLVGSRQLMAAEGVAVEAAQPGEGLSEICVAADGRLVGTILLADTVKEEASEAVAALHGLGVGQVMVLSGDRAGAVATAAQAVGADAWRAGLLPEEKWRCIEALKEEGRRVAFVGDGINDAPSIAAAHIGVAMGTLGTDMAMESADVVVAGDNLCKLAEGVRLSRRARRVAMENVAFAFGVKGAVMALAAIGAATLWAGVFADTGVTLITVLWTLLRLRK